MSRLPSPTTSWRGALLLGAAWLAYFGMLQWSVVRFRVTIVLTLTLVAALLAWCLVARARVVLEPRAVVVMLLASIPITVAVPVFSYVPEAVELRLRLVSAAAALVCAILLLRGPRTAAAAWLIAVLAYAWISVTIILADPAPRIDVWVTLQQASDALAHGRNFYTVSWVGSPGVKDAFTYLPWSVVLLAPGRLLAGDVRWMMLLWVLVAALGLLLLGRTRFGAPRAGRFTQRPEWTAAAVTAILLLAPGSITQIDQAWTEPLLFTALVWWALLMVRERPWWAVVPLALACASKQHLGALLLVLLAWRPFGPARAVATGALTGALVAPWFVTAPQDFVNDTITFLVGFHPIRFANTWYLLALNTWGFDPPFWLTGLIVIGTVAAAMIVVRRHDPPLGTVLRWCAFVLLVANLVNKQAFYNQYWLVGALVALSFLADAVTDDVFLDAAMDDDAGADDALSPPPAAEAAPAAPEPTPRHAP